MYANLKAELARSGKLVEDIAALLKIHRNSASNKVNGFTAFTVEEAFKVKDALFPNHEMRYLFAKYESKSN